MRPEERYAFQVLGLKADADAAAVKQAYAQKLKTCNPETQPVAWGRLHDAYKLAMQSLNTADQGAAAPPGEKQSDLSSFTSPEQLEPPLEEEADFEELFHNLADLAETAEAEEKKWQSDYEEEQEKKRKPHEVWAAKLSAAWKKREDVPVAAARRRVERSIRALPRKAWIQQEDLQRVFHSPDFYMIETAPWGRDLMLPLFALKKERFRGSAYSTLLLQYAQMAEVWQGETENGYANLSSLELAVRAKSKLQADQLKKKKRVRTAIVNVIKIKAMTEGGKARRNEHIGDGVLVFLKNGMAKRQTTVCQKNTIQTKKIMLLCKGS